MLDVFIDAIKGFFIKEEVPSPVGSKRIPHELTPDNIKRIDLSDIGELKRLKSPYNEICEADPNLKNVLVVDDCNVSSLYGVDFQIINNLHGKDVYAEYNVYQATGKDCGGEAYKFIKDNKVDYAILDLTLGNFYSLEDNSTQFVEIDGVDIAIEVLRNNPDAKIIFVSAHVFNARYDEFKEYIDKFKKYTGKAMDKFYLNKLRSDRSETFYKFLDLCEEE